MLQVTQGHRGLVLGKLSEPAGAVGHRLWSNKRTGCLLVPAVECCGLVWKSAGWQGAESWAVHHLTRKTYGGRTGVTPGSMHEHEGMQLLPFICPGRGAQWDHCSPPFSSECFNWLPFLNCIHLCKYLCLAQLGAWSLLAAWSCCWCWAAFWRKVYVSQALLVQSFSSPWGHAPFIFTYTTCTHRSYFKNG